MGLKLLIRENRAFFILHTLLLVLGGYPLVVFDKVALFLQLNRFHLPCLDLFFYYITFLGSSTMYILFVATLAAMQLDNRILLTSVCSFMAMSVTVQGMKRIFFVDQLRPTALIPKDVPLHIVEGTVPEIHLSFPSGHAATIFTTVCLIHLLMPKKPVFLSIFLIFTAIVVAYSRLYLCQHFYRDIYVGAWVGTWTTVLVYRLLMNRQGPAWLDQKLLAPWSSKRKYKAS